MNYISFSVLGSHDRGCAVKPFEADFKLQRSNATLFKVTLIYVVISSVCFFVCFSQLLSVKVYS